MANTTTADRTKLVPIVRLASGTTLRFSLCLKSGACHPISRRKLARELDDLNREDGSSAAMVDWRWVQAGKKAKSVGKQGAQENVRKMEGG
jgi:hypothetical protein